MATKVECPRCGEKSAAGSKCAECGLMLDIHQVNLSGAEPIEPDHVADAGNMIETPKDPAKRKPGKTVKECADCGRVMTIVARGLCGRCHGRHTKNGILDELYPAKRAWEKKQPGQPEKAPEGWRETAGNQPPAKDVTPNLPVQKQQAVDDTLPPATKEKVDNRISRITVNFYKEDEEFLKRLRASAKSNRRELSQEIIFRLESGGIA